MQPTVAAVIGVGSAGAVGAAAPRGMSSCPGRRSADGVVMSAPAAMRMCPLGMELSLFRLPLPPNAFCTAAAAAWLLEG